MVETVGEKYVKISDSIILCESIDHIRDKKSEFGKLEYAGFKLRFKNKSKEIYFARIISINWVRKPFRIKPSLRSLLVYLTILGLLVFSFWFENKPDSWQYWGIILSGSLGFVIICALGDELIHYMYGKWIKLRYQSLDKKQIEVYLNTLPAYSFSVNKLFKKLAQIQRGMF